MENLGKTFFFKNIKKKSINFCIVMDIFVKNIKKSTELYCLEMKILGKKNFVKKNRLRKRLKKFFV